MKKILTILAALILGATTFSAQAQLTITGKGEAPKKVDTLNPSHSWIYVEGDTFLLVVKSSNQFDPFFRLDLGDYETAGQTAKSLLDALTAAKIGDELIVESRGEKYMLTKSTLMGAQMWAISAIDTREVYAGLGYLYAADLRKAVKSL